MLFFSTILLFPAFLLCSYLLSFFFRRYKKKFYAVYRAARDCSVNEPDWGQWKLARHLTVYTRVCAPCALRIFIYANICNTAEKCTMVGLWIYSILLAFFDPVLQQKPVQLAFWISNWMWQSIKPRIFHVMQGRCRWVFRADITLPLWVEMY